MFDVMGGDLGPRPCVLAEVNFLRRYRDTIFHLSGSRSAIQRALVERQVFKGLVDAGQTKTRMRAPLPSMHMTERALHGALDLIVCDRFTGSVALKVGEGLGKHVIASLEGYFNSGVVARVSKLLAGFLIALWSRKKTPSLYNGAAFLGLIKMRIKRHGGADELGILMASEAAREQALANIHGALALISRDRRISFLSP